MACDALWSTSASHCMLNGQIAERADAPTLVSARETNTQATGRFDSLLPGPNRHVSLLFDCPAGLTPLRDNYEGASHSKLIGFLRLGQYNAGLSLTGPAWVCTIFDMWSWQSEGGASACLQVHPGLICQPVYRLLTDPANENSSRC